MTYQEMQRAEAEYQLAIAPAKQSKQRGATKAQLEYRAQRFVVKLRSVAPCVYCLRPLNEHTASEMLDCANARS